jgi:hypothetical protein
MNRDRYTADELIPSVCISLLLRLHFDAWEYPGTRFANISSGIDSDTKQCSHTYPTLWSEYVESFKRHYSTPSEAKRLRVSGAERAAIRKNQFIDIRIHRSQHSAKKKREVDAPI